MIWSAQNALTWIIVLCFAWGATQPNFLMAAAHEASNTLDEALKHLKNGDLARALTELEKNLKTSQDDPRIQELMGQVLDMLGRSDEALPYLQEAVRISPKQQAFWNNLAIVSLRVSKTEEGEKALHKSLDLGPNPLSFRLLGMIRFHQYRSQEGLALFRKGFSSCTR
jgi:Tfp pilus assembly protein PilF